MAPAQRVRATYSAHGATNFPQAGAVAPRWVHIWDMRRQLPVAVSKKSARRNGSFAIQSSNHASTLGSYGFEYVENERVTVGGVGVQTQSQSGVHTEGRDRQSGFGFEQGEAIVKDGMGRRHGEARSATQRRLSTSNKSPVFRDFW